MVLAMLRGVQDVEVLIEAAEILEVEVEELGDDRRRLLRSISNFIDSEEFEQLGRRLITG